MTLTVNPMATTQKCYLTSPVTLFACVTWLVSSVYQTSQAWC